jgi:hypothetical protein
VLRTSAPLIGALGHTMKCPFCNYEFNLSWSSYWKSPFGGHSCPACHEKFRLRHTFRYYLAVFGLVFFCALVPLIIAKSLGANAITGNLVYLLGMVAVFHFDKLIDNSWRGTVAKK